MCIYIYTLIFRDYMTIRCLFPGESQGGVLQLSLKHSPFL